MPPWSLWNNQFDILAALHWYFRNSPSSSSKHINYPLLPKDIMKCFPTKQFHENVCQLVIQLHMLHTNDLCYLVTDEEAATSICLILSKILDSQWYVWPLGYQLSPLHWNSTRVPQFIKRDCIILWNQQFTSWYCTPTRQILSHGKSRNSLFYLNQLQKQSTGSWLIHVKFLSYKYSRIGM